MSAGGEAFDEKEWQSVTTWRGAAPSYPDIWRLLTDRTLGQWFIDRLKERVPRSPALSAALAQALVESRRSQILALADFRSLTGHNFQRSTFERLLRERPTRARRWKNRFANLVSGRFTELVFEAAFSSRLAAVGLELRDATTDRTFIDYELLPIDPAEDFAASFNVKNAGRQFADAQRFVGLAPEDTLPMATYKAFGAHAQGRTTLLYAYLVDWTLLERLREAYWTQASEVERSLFRLFTTYSGMPRNVEDDFITLTVERRLSALREAVGYGDDLDALPFRVISAARCHSIFYERHQRSPYVFLERMDTDPNVHISVSRETIPFERLVEEFLSTPEQRAALIAGLGRTKQMDIPDPPV